MWRAGVLGSDAVRCALHMQGPEPVVLAMPVKLATLVQVHPDVFRACINVEYDFPNGRSPFLLNTHISWTCPAVPGLQRNYPRSLVFTARKMRVLFLSLICPRLQGASPLGLSSLVLAYRHTLSWRSCTRPGYSVPAPRSSLVWWNTILSSSIPASSIALRMSLKTQQSGYHCFLNAGEPLISPSSGLAR